MPFGFRFGERDQALFKKKYMLLCFGSGNHKGEMLPFKAFQTMGNQGKRV